MKRQLKQALSKEEIYQKLKEILAKDK